MSPARDHLRLRSPETVRHRTPGFRPNGPIPDRDVPAHADRLLGEIRAIRAAFSELEATDRAPTARGHLIKAEFAPESDANVGALEDKRAGAEIVSVVHDGAIVHLSKGELNYLERKVAAYADPDRNTTAGVPKNARLVSPLEDVRLASLSDISLGWLSEETVVPEREYWIELWMAGGRLSTEEERADSLSAVQWLTARENHGEVPDLPSYVAAEHDIYLIKLPGRQLRELPRLLPAAYRISPPVRAEIPWILNEDSTYTAQTGAAPADPDTVVVVADTGIAEQHGSLRAAIHEPGTSVVGDRADPTDRAGHGTRMAGIIAYADLADDIQRGRPLSPRTFLHSVKVMDGRTEPHEDLELWPERMEELVIDAEATAAQRRIYCVAIGAKPEHPGDSSLWSAAIDALSTGSRIFAVPTGNIEPSQGRPAAYPAENLAAGMTNPAEALNAVTVGAVTELTACSAGRTPVAQQAWLSPFSRCDVAGSRPIKPEVVYEGGNWATDGAGAFAERSLAVLTTSSGFAVGPPYTHSNATSAACAAASGALSEIWQVNPTLRAETVRGLLVHSARWKPEHRTQFPERVNRLRAVGYGIPSLPAAKHSTETHPSLVLESSIHPEAFDEGREMHLVALPLPDQALTLLGANDVEISVTLSYFADPNEKNSRQYQGGQLRWGIQRPLEPIANFRQRVNQLERTDNYETVAGDLPWEIGPAARSRGTIQSDRCIVPASDLLGSRNIAVWSVAGWWRNREDRDDAEINYSLIVSLNAFEADVNLYQEIKTTIDLPAVIEIEV